MRLRSRNILNANPTTPSRRRRAATELAVTLPQTPLAQTPVSRAILTLACLLLFLHVFESVVRVFLHLKCSARAWLA